MSVCIVCILWVFYWWRKGHLTYKNILFSVPKFPHSSVEVKPKLELLEKCWPVKNWKLYIACVCHNNWASACDPIVRFVLCSNWWRRVPMFVSVICSFVVLSSVTDLCLNYCGRVPYLLCAQQRRYSICLCLTTFVICWVKWIVTYSE